MRVEWSLRYLRRTWFSLCFIVTYFTMKIFKTSNRFLIQQWFCKLLYSCNYWYTESFWGNICSHVCPWPSYVPRSEHWVFRDWNSRNTVIFQEQVMSKHKYPRIFVKPIKGYSVYYPPNIFRNTQVLAKLRAKITQIFPSFCQGWYSVTWCVKDQSRTSENMTHASPFIFVPKSPCPP